jgi:hypothetical protein
VALLIEWSKEKGLWGLWELWAGSLLVAKTLLCARSVACQFDLLGLSDPRQVASACGNAPLAWLRTMPLKKSSASPGDWSVGVGSRSRRDFDEGSARDVRTGV